MNTDMTLPAIICIDLTTSTYKYTIRKIAKGVQMVVLNKPIPLLLQIAERAIGVGHAETAARVNSLEPAIPAPLNQDTRIVYSTKTTVVQHRELTKQVITLQSTNVN